MSTYILVVDDEPDVEHLFRQQFRRDIRNGRFVMEFAASAPEALERAKTIADPMLILILSDINMPGMTGLEMLPKVKAARPNVPVIMITGTFGRAAFTFGSISSPLMPGMLMSDRIRISKGSAIFFARSNASGADAANSMTKRPERMSRRNCWRNNCSTSGSSSTTRM